MKRILILVIWTLSCPTISAQKYTDQYIKDANTVGLSWLNDINHNQYENAYNLCTKEYKEKYPQETWMLQINELMLEFGNLESRTVIQRDFQSQIEGMEDGFYVFIEYSSQYENTKEHTEYLLLKQNDKTKWEIQIFEYMWQNKNLGE